MSIVPLPGSAPIETALRLEVSRCNCCGRAYDAEGWVTLFYVGEQSDGLGEVLELRNCPCGSTLAIDVSEAKP
jgi:hypothetical protein